MQVLPQQHYASSERIDANSSPNEPSKSTDSKPWDKLKCLPNTATKSAVETKPKSLTNDAKGLQQSWSSPQEFCTEKYMNHQEFSIEFNQDAAKQNLSQEITAMESKQLNTREKDNDVCDECLRNNYWMANTVLNKSADDLKVNG